MLSRSFSMYIYTFSSFYVDDLWLVKVISFVRFNYYFILLLLHGFTDFHSLAQTIKQKVADRIAFKRLDFSYLLLLLLLYELV